MFYQEHMIYFLRNGEIVQSWFGIFDIGGHNKTEWSQ